VRGPAGQRSIRTSASRAARASDAHADGPDRRCRHTIYGDGTLYAWCECGKADGGRVRPEDRVDVLEEGIADDPPWPITGSGIHENGPDTLAARDLRQLEVDR
jgi:hypothetical protein